MDMESNSLVQNTSFYVMEYSWQFHSEQNIQSQAQLNHILGGAGEGNIKPY